MGRGADYWRWRDEILAHPDGRAVGGEPCVLCGQPVPPNTHFKHRDRHVCSSRCNTNLARRFTRMLASPKPENISVAGTRPPPRDNPRTVDAPMVFDMLDGEFPYDFDGFAPQPGDTVIRHGSPTVFELLPAEQVHGLLDPVGLPDGSLDRGAMAAFHAATGTAWLRTPNTANGEAGRASLGLLTGIGGEELDFRHSPSSRELFRGGDGADYVWRHEFIRDLFDDGTDFTWTATVCVPADADHPGTLWTPAYRQRSVRRREVTATTTRHARRLREGAGQPERFAARDVFERDGWRCGICGEPVDPNLKWPDEWSASLDHVLPLAAGGWHTVDNTQCAHLICNIRKGART